MGRRDLPDMYNYVTGPAKTRHIRTNSTCSGKGTFLGPFLISVTFIYFLE